MDIPAFTHLVFWHNSSATLCFFALAMSFLSLWFKRTVWLWGSFLLIALFLAFGEKIISGIALIPITILLGCHYILKREVSRPLRYLLFCIAVVVSSGLIFHFLPGFHNWKVASNICLSPKSTPYNLWFNFDKPFIGIFVLALQLPLIHSRAQLFHTLKRTFPIAIVGVGVLIGISLSAKAIAWDPKIPTILFPWAFANLFLVTIPEEAFFRGFMQRQIYQWFGSTSSAAFLAIIVTSLSFVLLHVMWAPNLGFLVLVFIASLIYGIAYQVTQVIESSMICHFLFNATHLLLFTYPALQT